MNKILVLLSVAAALSLMAGLAFAGMGVAMHVNVPFDFYLEDQLLPAGEYNFEMGSLGGATASSVTVRATDGTGIMMIAALPGVDSNKVMGHLLFNQYGEKHFLSGVSIRGHKATLKMLKFEKELRSQLEKTRSTTTVAQN